MNRRTLLGKLKFLPVAAASLPLSAAVAKAGQPSAMLSPLALLLETYIVQSSIRYHSDDPSKMVLPLDRLSRIGTRDMITSDGLYDMFWQWDDVGGHQYGCSIDFSHGDMWSRFGPPFGDILGKGLQTWMAALESIRAKYTPGTPLAHEPTTISMSPVAKLIETDLLRTMKAKGVSTRNRINIYDDSLLHRERRYGFYWWTTIEGRDIGGACEYPMREIREKYGDRFDDRESPNRRLNWESAVREVSRKYGSGQ